MSQGRAIRWLSKLAIFLLAIVSATLVWAQGSGELTGVVTDPTAAVVARTEVKLTNDATGIVRTTVTTGAGVYRFTALPVVGTYTLSLEVPGYKPVNIAGVTISVGTTITQDIKLEVGSETQTVTVEAGAEQVQVAESQVSDLVNSRVWEQMPLAVRNQNEFINLVAGVATQDASGNNRGASVNGTRPGTGNFLVEGADNNDQGQGGRGQLADSKGGAVTSISPEAIQEYRVISNSYSAEYGKAGGFVTDTVLKSGTNQYHGSLFEYNRIQALAANDFFSNRAGLQDSLVRNQFGGSIGGPIIKDRTFFYSSLEFHRRRSSSPIKTTSTTQQFLDWVDNGGFANFMENDPNGYCMQNTGSTCPGAFSKESTVGPIFKELAAKGPFPLATSNFSNHAGGLYTGDSAGIGFARLQYPVPVYGDVTVSDPNSVNEYRWSLKIDHRISDKDSISGSYLLQNGNTVDQFIGGPSYIGPSYTNDGRNQNLVLSWNHSFTPTVLNTFKAGYLRHRQDSPNSPGYDNMPAVVTWFDPLGVGFGNSSNTPQFFTDNQFQYLDSLAWVKGKHSFKFGGEYRRIRNGSTFAAQKNGEFDTWDVESLVTDMNWGFDAGNAVGLPLGGWYSAAASVNPQTGGLPDYYRGYRANEYAFYAQDDWRVLPRLTLNIGVRYEYFGPPHNFKSNTDSNFYFGSPSTPLEPTDNPYFPTNALAAEIAGGSFRIRNNEIWRKDLNNWAPRFGFAWDVTGKEKLVVRGGAGIMYDRIFNNIFENIRFNPPLFSTQTIGVGANGLIGDPSLYTYPFSSTAAFADPANLATPNPRHMDQNLVTPYYEQFHFGVQYDLGRGYMVDTEYVGTMGHKLIGLNDINTFDGRTVEGYDNTRINPSIGADNFRTNAWNSNYNALQVTVKKHFSNGLQFDSNYTYAKAMDAMSDVFLSKAGGVPTDTQNIGYDYGPADFDLRHRWVTSFSYDLPFMKQNRWLGGWSTNGIITLQTGTPFSVTSSVDLNQNGYTGDRVPYLGTGSVTNSVLSSSPADAYLNTVDWRVLDSPGAVEATACPTSINNGQWCNIGAGRNSLYGPRYVNVDFGILKAFKITEGSKLTFEANFFNLFNRANFLTPVSSVNDPNFGKSIGDVGARQTQLALRFDF